MTLSLHDLILPSPENRMDLHPGARRDRMAMAIPDRIGFDELLVKRAGIGRSPLADPASLTHRKDSSASESRSTSSSRNESRAEPRPSSRADADRANDSASSPSRSAERHQTPSPLWQAFDEIMVAPGHHAHAFGSGMEQTLVQGGAQTALPNPARMVPEIPEIMAMPVAGPMGTIEATTASGGRIVPAEGLPGAADEIPGVRILAEAGKAAPVNPSGMGAGPNTALLPSRSEAGLASAEIVSGLPLAASQQGRASVHSGNANPSGDSLKAGMSGAFPANGRPLADPALAGAEIHVEPLRGQAAAPLRPGGLLPPGLLQAQDVGLNAGTSASNTTMATGGPVQGGGTALPPGEGAPLPASHTTSQAGAQGAGASSLPLSGPLSGDGHGAAARQPGSLSPGSGFGQGLGTAALAASHGGLAHGGLIMPGASMMTPPPGGSMASQSAQTALTPGDTRTAPMPIPLDQLAVQIARGASNGMDQISIRLKPAALGQVDVRLEFFADGRVNAVIAADKPETLDLLRGDSRSLERALQEAGLKADSGSLEFSLRGGEREIANEGRGRDQTTESGREAGVNDKGSGNRENLDRTASAEPDARALRGGIDLRV